MHNLVIDIFIHILYGARETKDFGKYYIVEQQSLRRAGTNVQTCQRHPCSHTQSMNVDKGSDQNVDHDLAPLDKSAWAYTGLIKQKMSA